MSQQMTAAMRARQTARHGDGKYAEMHFAEGTLEVEPEPHQTIVTPVFGEVEKKQRVQAMLDALEKGVAGAHRDPQKWAELVRFSSRFRQYSFRNSLLIGMQAPNATHVGSKSMWADAGGSIKKGAKAIWILAPRTYKEKLEDGNGNPIIDPETGEQKVREGIYFVDVPVFDISDIDGVEPPQHPWDVELLEGEEPPQMREDLTNALVARGYQVSYGDTGTANGYTSTDGRVVISDQLDRRQQVKTLAHELGHVAMGHLEPGRFQDYRHHRGEMEAEAEQFSFMVASEYGIDDAGDYTFGYVAGWTGDDDEQAAEAAQKAAESARKLLEEIHPAWKPAPIPELVAKREQESAARREAWKQKQAAARAKKAAATRKRNTAKKPTARRAAARATK